MKLRTPFKPPIMSLKGKIEECTDLFEDIINVGFINIGREERDGG